MKVTVKGILFSWLMGSLLVSGCAPTRTNEVAAPIVAGPTLPVSTSTTTPSATILAVTPAASDTARPALAASTSQAASAAITPTLTTDAWKQMPVVPLQISEKALQIYQTGLTMGNRPNAFSKVGDCESSTEWYLSDFDKGIYNLGSYTDVEPVITQYAGSFKRLSLATKPGFTAASLMVPLWSTNQTCAKNELPLACEYRLNRPSIALITLGTNDIHRPEKFEGNLRRVIEYSIQQGVLPVLATKADNLEKDGSINATIARLAYEYELPLWNFWLALQPLYHGGLQNDGAHLTWSPNDFSDPHNLKAAWPVRNLTALQVLNVVWRDVNH